MKLGMMPKIHIPHLRPWIIKKYFGISSTFSELKKSDIHELAIYADHEANPLYPVPVLWGVKELEKVYDFVVED